MFHGITEASEKTVCNLVRVTQQPARQLQRRPVLSRYKLGKRSTRCLEAGRFPTSCKLSSEKQEPEASHSRSHGFDPGEHAWIQADSQRGLLPQTSKQRCGYLPCEFLPVHSLNCRSECIAPDSLLCRPSALQRSMATLGYLLPLAGLISSSLCSLSSAICTFVRGVVCSD